MTKCLNASRSFVRIALTIVSCLITAQVVGAQTFQVSGAHQWLDTGITVAQGLTLELNASGNVVFPTAGPFGPEGTATFPGYQTYLAMTARRLGLVARVVPAGASPDDYRAVDFDYGTSHYITVPYDSSTADWRLWLAANGYEAGTNEYLVNVATVSQAKLLTTMATTGTSPTTGHFRVTINGFFCQKETTDDWWRNDGAGDEVTYRAVVSLVSSDGTTMLSSTPFSRKTMGDITHGNTRVLAGTATTLGGIQTSDSFPTATTPKADAAPMLLWEGDLTEGEHGVVIVPQIIEMDGHPDVIGGWLKAVAQSGPAIAGSVVDIIQGKTDAGSYLTKALERGLPALSTLYEAIAGNAQDRPIGMKKDLTTGLYMADPTAIALTFKAANLATQDDFGYGPGVLVLEFADDASIGGGHYFMFVQVSRNDQVAQFVSASVPDTMAAGQRYAASVTMRNTGSTAWTPTALYRLGSQNPTDNLTWGIDRVNVTDNVAPGADVTFSFTVTAPSTPGYYPFQWRMIQEGIGWFGDFTVPRQIGVMAPPPPPPAPRCYNYLGKPVPCRLIE